MSTSTPNPVAYGHIASLLRQKLSEHNMTITQFAKAIGATSSGVSYWMAAKGAPSDDMREKIVALFKVDASDLIKKMPGKALIVHAKKPKPGMPTKVSRITPSGTVKIQFDIELSIKNAQLLFKMIEKFQE